VERGFDLFQGEWLCLALVEPRAPSVALFAQMLSPYFFYGVDAPSTTLPPFDPGQEDNRRSPTYLLLFPRADWAKLFGPFYREGDLICPIPFFSGTGGPLVITSLDDGSSGPPRVLIFASAKRFVSSCFS